MNKSKVLIFDGAMGTMLQQEGLKNEYCPELLNIERADIVKKIHEKYLISGADVITTNTFGGNKLKLKEYDLEDKVFEINLAGVENARQVADKYNALVAASVGPCGQFVEPIGLLTFDEAYEIFKTQILALSEGKPDFIILETFNDLGEIRAALLAAKDVCDIPVICSLTFENGRTLTGVTPEAAATVLEALGAHAIGANCSGGPKELYESVKAIVETVNIPVIVQPNAGIPSLKDGNMYFPLKHDEFILEMEPYFLLGLNYIGSCCGSDPSYTKALKIRSSNYDIPSRKANEYSLLASREKLVCIGKDNLPKLIGERINPSAIKKIAQALKEKNYGDIQNEAIKQINNNAHLIDINVGTYGIDESEVMVDVINLLQINTKAPLVVDSTDPKVIEKALKTYHGKALVNSINGEKDSLDKILPLVKRYGSAVVALTLNEKGIPSAVEGRLEIAKEIVKECERYGISKRDIFIDPLALSLGSDSNSGLDTLKALKWIQKELKVNTILGVSNVSHGLPNRNKINSAFLSMAIYSGLDLAIVNTLDEEIINAWQAASFLSGRDAMGSNYIQCNKKEEFKQSVAPINEYEISIENLKNHIVQGSHNAINIAEKLIGSKVDSLEIVNEGIIKALNIVGDKFECGEYFLPQLMMSAEITEKIFKALKLTLKEGNNLKKETIVIGTVKGDIHDIGKNMVAVMLKSHGYNVIDLGKNVSKEEFLEAAKKEKADFIALSALMTTTMVQIPVTIEYVKTELPNVKVIVGGAVVTQEYADESGANGYSSDAVGAVKLVESLSALVEE